MRGRPDVSDFLLFRRERGWRAFPEFRRRVQGRRFDVVLDIHRAFKAGLVTRMLEAPVKLGYDRLRARDLNWLFTTHRIPTRGPRHVQDQFFEFLDFLGVPVVREWDFFFTAEERAAQREFFHRLQRPVLAVVLRSSKPEKDWILARYARVLEIAESDLGLQPVLVGGASAAELDAAARVERQSRARPRNELANDLRRLAWLLAGSSVVLSPDTGPLHMAVAVGTPTVGLYGFTDPKRSGPYRRFAGLLIDRYPGPEDRPPSREGRTGNMERIEVGDVVRKLEYSIARYGTALNGKMRSDG
jgi:heptosyltransferase I